MTTYKNHEITRTNVTTSVLLPLPGGRQYEAVRRVYAIEGRYGKSAWVRPFITSLAGAREYINDELEHEQLKAEEWDGQRRVTRTPHDPYGRRNGGYER